MKIAHISDIHFRGTQRHDEYVAATKRLVNQLENEDKPDIIVCTGDIWHTKTNNITPEGIDVLVWFFRTLANVAPLHMILGNHDGNLANETRQDVISPIVEAMNDPRIKLYKKSGVYQVRTSDDPLVLNLCVMSCFDKENWNLAEAPKRSSLNEVTVALYHGSITGCVTDSDWVMSEGEESLDIFNLYDFAMLGDIHKRQYLRQKYCPDTGKMEAVIAYPGSMIQQNFGEEESKGYLIWDIKSANNWSVDYKEIYNATPFITIPWVGSFTDTIETVKKIRNTNTPFLPGSRVRVVSDVEITPPEIKQLQSLKQKMQLAEIAFKIDTSRAKNKVVQTSSVTVTKNGLRNNQEALGDLFREYIKTYSSGKNQYILEDEEKLKVCDSLIKKYFAKFKELNEESAKDVIWSVDSLEFSNLFRYGDNNKINFKSLNGLVGIFGPNKIGKSSLPGALMYGLFNTTSNEVGKAVGHLINRRKTSASAKVNINIGGNHYQINRSVSLKSAGKAESESSSDEDMATVTSLTLNKIEEDGSLIPMGNQNDITRNDTDKLIRNLIGTPGDFRLSAYSSQDNVGRFVQQGATQRKAILNRFLDLDIFGQLFDFANADKAELATKTKTGSTQVDWKELITKCELGIKHANESIEQLNQKEYDLRSEMADLQVWIGKNEVSLDATEYTKLAEKKIKIQNDLDKAKLSKQKLQQKFEDLSFEKQTLRFSLNELQDKVKDVKQQLKNISNVEELERSLSELISLRETLKNSVNEISKETSVLDSQKKNVKKLETIPCGDQFPTCRFVKDSHEDKLKIADQQAQVTNLTKQKEILETRIGELSALNVEGMMKKKTQLENELFELENRKMQNVLNSQEKNKNQLESNISDLTSLEEKEKELAETFEFVLSELAKFDSDSIEANKKILQANKDRLTNIAKEISILSSRIACLYTDLGEYSAKIKQYTKEKKETEDNIEKIKILEAVMEAFGKNGIPAMILKTQLPIINEELAKILAPVSNFKVTLKTEVSSNALDVYIEDEGSRRILELGSGMETMIAGLAIRVALLNVSSIPHPDFLIIDEGLSVLDQDNMPKCLQLLQGLKSYFKTILIVSHIPAVQEIVDSVLEITNNGFESKINFE